MASLGSLTGFLGLNATRFRKGAKEAATSAAQMNRRFAQGQKQFRTFGKSADRLGGRMTSLGRSLAGVAAIALGGFGFGSAVRTIAAFGKEVATLQGLTKGTAAEIASLRDQALKLGKTSIFTASEAAQSQVTLARVGLSVNQILKTTPAILELAQSSSIGLAEASDILVSALAGMGKGADDAQHFVNLLSVAANTSNQTVLDLGAAFSFVAPPARILGVTAELLAASVGVLSDSAVKGEKAGTGLRQTFIKLSSVNKGAQVTLEKYGLSLADVDVATRGFLPVLESLRAAGFGAAEAFGDLTKIFEARASSSVVILIKSLDKLKMRLQVINRETQAGSRYAAEIAAIQDNTLYGALKKVASAWEGVILAFGEVTGSGLQEYLEGVADDLREISSRAESLQKVGDAFQLILETLGFLAENLQHILNAILALIAVKVLAGIYALAKAFAVLKLAILSASKQLTVLNAKQYRNLGLLAIFALIEGYQLLTSLLSETGEEGKDALKKAGEAADSFNDDVKKLDENFASLVAKIKDAGKAGADLPKQLGLSGGAAAGQAGRGQSGSTDFHAYQDQARQAQRELERSQRFHAYQQKQLLNRRAILTEYQALARQISTTLTGSLSDGVKNFVRGTGSLKDILSGVAGRLSDVLLDSIFAPLEKGLESLITDGLTGGISSALGKDLFGQLFSDLASGLSSIFSSALSGIGGLFKGLFSGLGASLGGFLGFAQGGQVQGGQPIVVGEKGREVFTPFTDGYIIPNHDLSGIGGGGGGVQVSLTFQISSTDGSGVRAALERAQPVFTRAAVDAVSEGIRRGGSRLRSSVRNAR